MKTILIGALTTTRRVLTQMTDGTLKPVKQNDDEATYTLKRSPEDGLLRVSDFENVDNVKMFVGHKLKGQV